MDEMLKGITGWEQINGRDELPNYKICIITTISKTMDWFIVDNMRYLSQHGYNVTLICDMDDEFYQVNSEYATCIPLHMCRGINPINLLKSIHRIYKIFKSNHFDMIQYSTPNAALYASFAGRLAKVPVRLYCQWGLRYVGFKGFKHLIFKNLEYITCKNSTWVEPDSFGNLQHCRTEKLYSEKKSSVVWNGSAAGVDLKKFDLDRKSCWRNEIRNQYGIESNEFVFGFVGRVDKDKGFNEMITAFKKIDKQATFIFVGLEDKVETVDEALYDYTKNLDKFIYSGVVSDVQRYISAMDCLILPSYREGFGSVVIEAGAMQVPSIVTNIVGPKESVVDEKTGLIIEQRNPDELYVAMERIMNDADLRETLGTNARARVLEYYEKEKLFEYILKDRNRLLSSISKRVKL